MSKLLSKAATAFSKNEPTSESEDGESLTTILRTPEERSALTLLVADCAEAMREIVVHAFDVQPEANDSRNNDIQDQVEPQPIPNETSPPLVESSGTAASNPSPSNEPSEKTTQKDPLESADLQTLKDAALADFDEWRGSVIQRIGEVVNSRERETHSSGGSDIAQRDNDHPSINTTSDPSPLSEHDTISASHAATHYSPIDTPLNRLPEAKRATVMHSLLLLLLSLETYRAHSRVLLVRLCSSLHLATSFLEEDESKVAQVLLSAAQSISAEAETKQAAEQNKSSRRWKVGLASVAGAALIGITGGLAAPLLAAGLGSVMGGLGLGATAAAGYLGALTSSSVLVGSLFGVYGAKMTGKMMDQYAREVEDFAFVPVNSLDGPVKQADQRRLRVAIGITGWLTSSDEVVEPWRVLGKQMERFALRWELESLMGLGNAMTTMITSAAWSYAKVEIIKRTLFGALYAGLWPLGLLKVSRIIDNPFAVANYRAQKAGEVLADALINKAQGERPVTLVGYSLGGKVIFTCLRKLAERQAFGIVEDVVIIGSPAPGTAVDWRRIRSVVAGRVVNVYSSKDYLLAFLYRSHSTQVRGRVAGLQAIDDVAGIENFDVSELVTSHTSYRHLNGAILKRIGFVDIDEKAILEEEEARTMQEAKEEMERERSTEESEASSEQVPAGYVEELEKEVAKKNEQSYIAWTQEKLVAAGASTTAALERARAQFRSSSNTPDHNPAVATYQADDAEQPPPLPVRVKQ